MSRRDSTEPAVVPSGFFVLRTPLLPVDELNRWAADLRLPAALSLASSHQPGAELEKAVQSDRALLRKRLKAFVARPVIAEAIFLASPPLYAGTVNWLRHPNSKRAASVERSLVRYLYRMTTRSTPYGLFAGWTTGDVADRTCLELPPRGKYSRHTRLDARLLSHIHARLLREKAVRKALTWIPNTTLHVIGGSWRFVATTEPSAPSAHVLVEVEGPELDMIIRSAAQGARYRDLLDVLLVDRDDAPAVAAQAEAFVDSLIEGQVLVPKALPAVSGSAMTRRLKDELGSDPEASKFADELSRLERLMQKLDSGG